MTREEQMREKIIVEWVE